MSAGLDAAVAAIASRSELRPRVGVVLGSGLGGFADAVSDPVEIPYGEIPGWPASTAVGHAGHARRRALRRRSGRRDEGPRAPLRGHRADCRRLRGTRARPARRAEPRPHERVRRARPLGRAGAPRRDLRPPEPPGDVAPRRAERRGPRAALSRPDRRLRPRLPDARATRPRRGSGSSSGRASTPPGSAPPSRRLPRSA